MDPRIQVGRGRGARSPTPPGLPREPASTRTHALQPCVFAVAGWRLLKSRSCTEGWDTPFPVLPRGRLRCPRGRGLIIARISADPQPKRRVPATRPAVQADCNKGKRGRGPPRGVGVPWRGSSRPEHCTAPGLLSSGTPAGGHRHRGGLAVTDGCHLPLRRGLHWYEAPREPSPGGGAWLRPSSSFGSLSTPRRRHCHRWHSAALGLTLVKTLRLLVRSV